MIALFPAVRLRELTKSELLKLDDTVGHMSSVDKIIAGAFYRFASDNKCPAFFVQPPKTGDEPIKDVVYLKDYPTEELEVLARVAFNAAADKNYGTKDIKQIELSDRTWLYIKEDFLNGEWSNFGYEYTGKDGVSISC